MTVKSENKVCGMYKKAELKFAFKRQKVVHSPYGGEIAASQMRSQKEQQQQQPGNRSSENAEFNSVLPQPES